MLRNDRVENSIIVREMLGLSALFSIGALHLMKGNVPIEKNVVLYCTITIKTSAF